MNIDNKIIIAGITAILTSGGIAIKEINLDSTNQIVNEVITISQRALKTLEPYSREAKRIAQQLAEQTEKKINEQNH